jgi:membrane-associated phospholipid phosphatase
VSRVGEAIVGVDDSVAATLHSLVTPPATVVLEVVTALGSTLALAAVVIVAAAWLVWSGARSDAKLVLATFAGAEALTWSLKAVFHRERPVFDDPIATASSFSYPSGHALVSVAVYGVIAYVFLGRLRRPGARAACLATSALLVAAIGFSRLYLGVHYLSDVLAGFSVGASWLILATSLRDRVPARAPALAVAAVLVLGLATACGGNDDADAPELPQAGEAVQLDPDDFVERIDNPYWPMAPGSKWTFRGSAGERVDLTVTDRHKRILGIEATVVHDVESEDGEVVEDTYDWFAQDRWGNVWYLGEATKEYEDGEVVSTKGSWQAGVDGAYGGIVMPGEPRVGQAYRAGVLRGRGGGPR